MVGTVNVIVRVGCGGGDPCNPTSYIVYILLHILYHIYAILYVFYNEEEH